MKQAHKNINMGFGLLGFAFLFFFNPNINIIDFLPDFIGYMLLCRALSKLADLNESIGSAVSIFRKMFLIDLGKWLALLWVFGMSVTSERNSSLLLWTFVFAILELIFLVPAYSKLFAGITQLGYFYPNRVIFGDGTVHKKRSATDKIRNFTIFFVLVKAILPVLPELADLSNTSYDESKSLINLYRYIGIMRVLAFIPVLIIGLIWLVRVQMYFRNLRRDSLLMNSLTKQYEIEICPKNGMFVRRNFRTVYVLLILAFCLTLDFRLEYQNYIPDFLAAICFFASFWMLKKHTNIKLGVGLTASVAYFLVSIGSVVAESGFFSEYYYGAILKSEKAMQSYSVLLAVNFLKALIFCVLVWALIRALFAVITAHTGYVAGQTRIGSNEEKMIRDLQGDLKRTLIYAYVTAILYAISDICYDCLVPTYGFIGLINLFFAVLCIGFFVRALSSIQNSVDTKYMLE